ncbi:helix-turn-helix domain-containing protein [Xanthomonas perforans]|jgi:putative transcriptional regulator|uniref:XRE family transcriptional regulator n=1 Tax=Pseudomonas syringae pv. delphinii TaxID=192088 RepID=A0A3M4JRL9_9PSED|nr:MULTISPECIES: helix-turn-helix domain-containing protein [Pseudomonadota]KWU19069.1 transcriptional regulator [Burkholderia cenocepacia]MCC8508410.1 helix-turn-helix domain-containing protein [Xanthomonas hortorum pv. gardneri]MCC8525757.1 helix-turn-helix domain-containing protein [Xanthomonas hortorum pv. gardneri]RMQ19566.1 XRE family transcriptional regulator [Pseudomonas syringae pv. delphinii]
MAKKLSNLTTALLETAEDLHGAGLLGDGTYEKITARHLGSNTLATAAPISPEEIRSVREGAHLSQAALAKYLNLTTGYVSQLERGTKQAKGPALALLNVIRRKGIEALL